METKILSVMLATPSVTSYHIEKPANFNYKPGQFINIEIPVPNPDNRGSKRNSSLSSSPTEDFLMISMRHGVSTFKHTFEHIAPNTQVKILGPLGRFVLNEDESIPMIMLTGGIGMTPFRSMIKYATDTGLKKQMTLLYANKTADDIPFKAELDVLDQQNEYLQIHYTMTQDEKWTGHKGRIDEAMIKELAPQWQQSEFYVCGPPRMVEALRSVLKSMKIPDEQVKFEPFTGY